MITPQMIKQLRDKTGSGFMDCKRALIESEGDFAKATDKLRQWGLASAGKKADRTAEEGLVEAYIHGEGRLGVMVEVNCETDFVTLTAEFKAFAHEIALQIAAKKPLYVSRDDVPAAVLERERAIYAAQAVDEGKPEAIAERIVLGRIEKYYQDVCLLEQLYIRDQDKSARKIGDLVGEMVTRFGENIQIRRFARMELGERIDA